MSQPQTPGKPAILHRLSVKTPSPTKKSARLFHLEPVPAILRPLVRAYILGYASAVAPRLLTLLLQHLSRRRRSPSRKRRMTGEREEPPSFVASVQHILGTGLELHRFPAFCAALVGGTTILQEPLFTLISHWAKTYSKESLLRLSRWISSFLAAWLSLQLLQSKLSPPFIENIPSSDDNLPASLVRKYGGRTLDLTLFASTRALDVIVGELWSQRKTRRLAVNKWSKAERLLSTLTDPMVFVASSGLIMWSWFYHPDRLPKSYNKWITSAASVDLRLIEALRKCRSRELRYGEDTGQAPLLGGMCVDYNLPTEMGDPAKSIPFSCDIVHMGCGPSCEWHAVSRLARSWRWAMFTYLPLSLAMVLRHPSRKNLLRAFTSASRSSTFLAVFITLFYYGVCLGRTRLGPSLLGRDVQTRQQIDGGVCVGVGCALCGWSVLVETASRRKDMALFVAPRALATLVERRYAIDKQWRETLVFAASTAVVLTCALENPKRVRGVLGGILNLVLAP